MITNRRYSLCRVFVTGKSCLVEQCIVAFAPVAKNCPPCTTIRPGNGGRHVVKQWRWYDRADQVCRLRRERDDGIHVRKNGDLYLVHPGIRPRRARVKQAQG